MAHETLTARLDRLAGCAGVWILDRRDSNQRGYDLDRLPCFGIRTPEAALQECISQHWRDCRLLFSPDRLNDDTSWPGGYDAPSHYRSNARVFRAEFASELELADGDADGIALDLRYVTDEMLETIEALESYPVLDEGDHSELELDCQQQAWECWAASDWRDIIRDRLAAYCPAAVLDQNQYGPSTAKYWADDQLDTIPDADLDRKLQELFAACAENQNQYWEEQSGGDFWINLERVAVDLDRDDLAELTGLALLDPGQEWRRRLPSGAICCIVSHETQP
jgi:hypothetical protein